MVIEINEKDFDDRIRENCIVDFFATWCAPCKMLSPVIEKVSEEYKGKLKFYKINIDNNRRVVDKYKITGVPTLILFKNGNLINKTSGYMDEKELIKFMNM